MVLVDGWEYRYCRKDKCQSLYQKELEGYEANPRFCEKCLEETLPESCGNVETINFVGTTLSVLGDKCPVCHSIVAEKRNVVFGVRLKSLGYYRIIYLEGVDILFLAERIFLSRKLKNQSVHVKFSERIKAWKTWRPVIS